LAGDLAQATAQAAAQAVGELAEQLREQARMALGALVHAVIDAQSYAEAEAAWGGLLAHPQGAAIGNFLNAQLDQILVHLAGETNIAAACRRCAAQPWAALALIGIPARIE
jgi:uncharacterized membrane protein